MGVISARDEHGQSAGGPNARRSGPSVPATLVADGPRRDAACYRALVELLPDAAFALDMAGHILEANAACATLWDTTAEALVGRALTELVRPEDVDATIVGLERARECEPQTWCVHPLTARETRPVVELTAGVARVDGQAIAIVGVARDRSWQSDIEAKLRQQAQQDPLTGLANRAQFHERVERALVRYAAHLAAPAAGQRVSKPVDVEHVVAEAAAAAAAAAAADASAPPAPGHHVAVICIDLDDFKIINDSLGHAEGDRLLEEISARLLKATRGFDLVARLGGDEFGVLLEGMTRETDASSVIERIAMVLKRPVTLRDREVVIGASLGVAHARDARNADELLRNADMAMYQAKTAGKGRYAEFDHRMHAAAVERLEIAADLRHAVERQELFLAYQPVVQLATGKVVGVEALLRWQRPNHGVVPPLSFIPLAEDTGLIVPIGRWVLRAACAQLARWRDTLDFGATLSMNVNVSGRQLTEPGFVEDVLEAVIGSGIPPQLLTLEITESVIVQRADEVLAVLHALRASGVRLAIDDFGTGYSSLGYLQHFPVDVLKIDRSFVDSVARGGSEAALARTIVALGNALGLEAVAEGIEHGSQQEALAALGCERGQGYFFARPLDPAEFARRFGTPLSATPVTA